MIVGFEATLEGRDALRLASLLGEPLGAPAIVATVLPLPAPLVPAERVTRALDAPPFSLFAAPREELGARISSRVIADASPARALRLLADAEDAGLIVVGASHRGRIDRAVLGSVGEGLVRDSRVPVAVAPRGYSRHDLELPRAIGVAYDGSRGSELSLGMAVGLASGWGAGLRVIAVEDDHVPAELAALTRLLPAGLNVDILQVAGESASTLLEESDELDLLLTGRRSRGVIKRSLFGSVTRKLITACRCPILVTADEAVGRHIASQPPEARSVATTQAVPS